MERIPCRESHALAEGGYRPLRVGQPSIDTFRDPTLYSEVQKRRACRCERGRTTSEAGPLTGTWAFVRVPF